MVEQTSPDFGRKMFRDINAREVVHHLGDAVKAWWNDHSPKTIARDHVEAFDNVVARVDSADLRRQLEQKRGDIERIAHGAGVVAAVGDAFLATVPLALRWRGRIRGDTRMRQDVAANATNIRAGQLRKSPEYRQRAHDIDNMETGWAWESKATRQARYNAARGQFVGELQTRARADLSDVARRQTFVNKEVGKRMIGRRIGSAAILGGVGGIEAAVLSFRPISKLAKGAAVAEELAGTWVVDHIVNNIIKGGERRAV